MTARSEGTHNRYRVPPSFSRTVVSLILAPCVAFSAILAPEHVHEAEHDHPHSTVHRHTQAHGIETHHHDHDDAKLNDDDGHVVWLDNVTLQQAPFQFAAPVAPPEARFELVSLVAGWHAKPDYSVAPLHGPPRSSLSLRAPPSCLSA